MPFVICKQHGGSPAPLVCAHAAKKVWAGEPPDKLRDIDLDGFLFKGRVCGACYEVLTQKGLKAYLPDEKGQRSYPCEEELEKLLNGLDLQPVCPKCLELLTK
jgi:hypothetical protein